MAKRTPSITTENFTAVQLMELDACSRCGECVDWCPTYDASGHRPGLAPRDKILRWRNYINQSYGLRAMLFGPKAIPEEDIEEFKNDVYGCTTCGICATVCESAINTVELWESMRANLVKRGNGPYGKQTAFLKLITEYKNPYMEDNKNRVNWFPADIKVEEHAEILYFGGCTAELKQRKLALATTRLLNKLGIKFTMLGEDEICCGSALIRTGQYFVNDIAKNNAQKNIDNIKAKGAKIVLYACAGCFRASKVDWPRLTGQELPFKVVHITQFLQELIEKGDIKWQESINKKVTYHDPCHLGRHVGVYEPPRAVLNAIPGIELIEMERIEENQRCCGAGGGVKAGIPDLALKVASTRVEDALITKADILSSACPFCKRNLSDGRDAIGAKELVVEDVVVLAAEAMGIDLSDAPE